MQACPASDSDRFRDIVDVASLRIFAVAIEKVVGLELGVEGLITARHPITGGGGVDHCETSNRVGGVDHCETSNRGPASLLVVHHLAWIYHRNHHRNHPYSHVQ